MTSGTLNRQFTSCDEARFISTWTFSSLPVKWLNATTAGIATKMPKAVETRASAIPPETTDMIETVAINQLDVRRERLVAQQNQARYGVADSYDRAARTQSGGEGR